MRPNGRSKKLREEKRRLIQKAALAAFTRKGYHRTTMKDIAEEAGIGKSTIYEYFHNKEELFLSLFDYAGSQFLENLKEAVKDIKDPLMALREAIEASTQSYREWKEFLRLIILFISETTDEKADRTQKLTVKLKNFYVALNRELSTIIEKGIKEGAFRDANPSDLAAFLIALIDGLSFRWLVDRQFAQDKNKLCKSFFKFVTEGIVNKSVPEAGGIS